MGGLARIVGGVGRLRRSGGLGADIGAAGDRRIGRHLCKDWTAPAENRSLSAGRLTWSSCSVSHQRYLALLSIERVIAPSLNPRGMTQTRPIGEIRLRPRVRTGLATASVIVRGHDISLEPSPLPRIGSMQLVHGVNAEDPQTRRQDALRSSHQGDTSTR